MSNRPDSAERRLLTFRESQLYLNISRAALGRLMRCGAIPVVTLASRTKRPFRRIAVDDLDALIARTRSAQ